MVHEGKRVLAIDLEFAQTYKKKLKMAAIMEVGLVFVENIGLPSEIEKHYSKMFNPNVPINSYASKITGITDKMLVGLPSIQECHSELQDYFDKAEIIIFHGGSPDLNALTFSGFKIDQHKIIDTQMLAKYDERNYNGYSLKALAIAFNLNSNGAHRALKDAIMTLGLYKKLAHSDHPLFQICNKDLLNNTL